MRKQILLRAEVSPQIVAAQPTGLVIVEIRNFAIREPISGSQYSLLRITTRSGLIGWGECRFDPNADIKALRAEWVGRPAHQYATITSVYSISSRS